MRRRIKLDAGALQYAIFISIVIALLVTAFISMSFVQAKLKIRSTMYKTTIENANHAFNYAMMNDLASNFEQVLTRDSEKGDSTFLMKSAWGMFDLITVEARMRNEKFQKAALLGGHQSDRLALNLQDLNRPLVVVGNAQLEGNVRLSEKGVKRGSISGKSYYGSELVYGNIFPSQSQLPKLVNRDQILRQVTDFFDDQNVEYLDEFDLTKISRSFYDIPMLMSSWNPVILDKLELKGKIIVHSDVRITVAAGANLEDVILMAPEIIIEDGVRGCFQAIATENIELGEACELYYPSALILVDQDLGPNLIDESKQIVINKHSEVRGLVVYLTDKKEQHRKSLIDIKENAVLMGEVYSEVNIDLRGIVLGSVITKGFVVNHNGSMYQNHILNGKIIENKLPEQYCGLMLKNERQDIVKWLY